MTATAVKTRAPAAKPFTIDHFRKWAKGLVLDTGEHWEVEQFFADWLEDVFDGVPEAWLIVPEGNSKTTSVAGLGLYHCEFTASAWCPVAASSREQAEVMYRQAEGFVLRSVRLRKVFKCQEGYRRIKYLPTGSRLQVMAADDRTGDGIIPTLALVDEGHRHRDLRLYRTWRGKLDKRGGQVVMISTAGEPGSEFEEARDKIRDETPTVASGPCFVRCRSEQIAFHEYAVPADGDVNDLEIVKQANPFSALTVETLARKQASPTMTVPHWRRFVCNLATRSDMAAIQEAEWAAAATREEIPAGEPIWLGLDVAWKWDTTAAVPLWVRDPTFRLLGRPAILVPPRDGTSLRPALVEEALRRIHDRNPVHTVVMDTIKAEQLAEWIRDEFGAEVVDRSQSNSFACMDYERFMEALRRGWLRHGNDPGLNQHALNAITKQLPGGDSRFERPKEGRRGPDQDRRVIDALVAAAMVHGVVAAEFADPDDELGLYVFDPREGLAA
jgi:phage terminase large subunit-like protein